MLRLHRPRRRAGPLPGRGRQPDRAGASRLPWCRGTEQSTGVSAAGKAVRHSARRLGVRNRRARSPSTISSAGASPKFTTTRRSPAPHREHASLLVGGARHRAEGRVGQGGQQAGAARRGAGTPRAPGRGSPGRARPSRASSARRSRGPAGRAPRWVQAGLLELAPPALAQWLCRARRSGCVGEETERRDAAHSSPWNRSGTNGPGRTRAAATQLVLVEADRSSGRRRPVADLIVVLEARRAGDVGFTRSGPRPCSATADATSAAVGHEAALAARARGPTRARKSGVVAAGLAGQRRRGGRGGSRRSTGRRAESRRASRGATTTRIVEVDSAIVTG